MSYAEKELLKQLAKNPNIKIAEDATLQALSSLEEKWEINIYLL